MMAHVLRRAGRHLLTMLSALLLLLCLATCVLWVRSYWVLDSLRLETRRWIDADQITLRSFGVSTLRGRCTFFVVDNTFDLRYVQDLVPSASPGKVEQFRDVFRKSKAPPMRFEHESDPIATLPGLPAATPWWKVDTEQYRQPKRAHSVAQRSLLLPAWMPTAVLAIAPLIVASAWLRKRRRARPGCCPQCGYDLRATPERCPECGAVPSASRAGVVV